MLEKKRVRYACCIRCRKIIDVIYWLGEKKLCRDCFEVEYDGVLPMEVEEYE